VKHAVILTLVLSMVWLLWSAHFEPLLLSLGAGSLLFVVWLSARMKVIDSEGAPLDLRYGRIAGYVPWLAWEIVKANLDVARCVLRPGAASISPRLIRVPASQQSEVGQVIYANSITLTPGTVSIDLGGGEVLVHALHADAAAGVETGEMDRRCTALEPDGLA
jgi:multicomponent Na+:H+ antiporter subunit E